MKRLSSISICLALSALGIQAQGPNGSGTYYIDADGKSGEELKTALFGIISKQTKTPSYDAFIQIYKTTDTRADGKVRDWYSNVTNYVHEKDKAGSYKQEGDVYNREHLVPQDWGAAKAGDVTYVVPTDGFVNGKRSNLPFGEVNKPTYQSANGYSKVGPSVTPGFSGTVFEPNDEVKGDIARIYFYMTTRYETTCTNWSGPMFTGSTSYQPLAQWAYDMLVRWAKLDPVDDVETARNNAIARKDIQGNRNPFVDYPGLEDYIWGDKKDVDFSYDNYDSDIIVTERVAQPVFSPEGGTFADQVVVTITTATEGATIYYTTDGTDASANSNVYSEPLTLTRNTTLKAVAVKEGMKTSYQQTATYVIKSSQPGEVTTDEMTIALNNSFFGTSFSGSVSGGGDFSGTKDGITVTYSKGSSSNQYINDAQIRLYPGNTLTVSSAEGDITAVELTKVGGKGDRVLRASTGTVSGMTWTGMAQTIAFSVDGESGHIQFSQLKVTRAVDSPQPPQPVKGDVNGDGTVDVADIATIISVMASGSAGDSPASADVNGDGAVDVADIATVISIMAGQPVSDAE